MKKKVLSFFCGIFMCIFSLFTFCGCSLIKVNTEQLNKEPSIKVGDVTLSRSDILSSFYTYYQSNNNYFAYYDNATIEESFYTWAVIREILNQKSNDALYDAEKNPEGYIYYTEDDEKEVLELTFEYIYNQISTKEKAIYKLEGYEEDEYPVWLKTQEDEESNEFVPYESAKPEVPDADRVSKVVAKSTDEQIKAKITDLKKYVFEYVFEEVEDGDDVRKDIDETDYLVGTRNQAYAEYIESLVTTAKSNGTSTDESIVLENELIRVYNAYYKTQITTLFQKYCLEELLLEYKGMSEKAIVEAYLNAYFTDVQVYQVENSYISKITSTDGTPLVFYHFNGQNYFFTVQQILVKFDDKASSLISALPGYSSSSSSDYDKQIADIFKQERENLATERDQKGAMLTPINEKSGITSVEIVGGYYHYDESLNEDASKNFGYIPLKTQTTGDQTIYFYDGNDSGIYEDNEPLDVLYDASEVKFMASKADILNAYSNNYNLWSQLATDYFGVLETGNQQSIDDFKKNNSKFENYIFETIENMHSNGNSLVEIKTKLSSYLFLELEWIYSGDSLKNDLSGKLGYVVSNYPDENGSWVPEFAVGARELMSEYAQKLEQGQSVDTLTTCVTSNYGYHILKIENVYKGSPEGGYSLVDLGNLLDNPDLNDENFVRDVIQKLKRTYVSTASNQTVYDYFFDELYTGFAGTSSGSGTYFLKLEYEWLHDYYKIGKIEYLNKIPYDQLMAELR